MKIKDLSFDRLDSQGTYPPNFLDLASLFTLAVSEKIVSVLEFGSGWSTLVLAAAVEENSKNIGNNFNLRHPNPFKVQSIDCSEDFLELSMSRVRKNNLDAYVLPVLSKSHMGTYGNLLCHYFDNNPAFTADLIYLDGPDPMQVEGSINGFSVAFGDSVRTYGLPMSADILAIEFFLWPGTFLVIDGRGANAEFLRRNLKREWEYVYSKKLDQHFFNLKGPAWGKHSASLMSYRSAKPLPEVVHLCETTADTLEEFLTNSWEKKSESNTLNQDCNAGY